jgi:hypothetical protein
MDDFQAALDAAQQQMYHPAPPQPQLHQLVPPQLQQPMPPQLYQPMPPQPQLYQPVPPQQQLYQPTPPQLSMVTQLQTPPQPPGKADLAARAAAILNNKLAAKAGSGVAAFIGGAAPAAPPAMAPPNLNAIAAAAACALGLPGANAAKQAVSPAAAAAPLTTFTKGPWPPITYAANQNVGMKIFTAERVAGHVRHDILVQV